MIELFKKYNLNKQRSRIFQQIDAEGNFDKKREADKSKGLGIYLKVFKSLVV